MEDKVHAINGAAVTVSTQQLTLHPLSYKITAKHPSGASHEESLTIGDKDLNNVASLDTAQSYLDSARERIAQMCGKKAAISALAANLK